MRRLMLATIMLVCLNALARDTPWLAEARQVGAGRPNWAVP